ncbi:hypothetical protein HK098_002203 [Nowakowskiella sp. JEL0407]|nr:hypothetical protein HK098_002203 [Nowakowskiella sp. JEL0407]
MIFELASKLANFALGTGSLSSVTSESQPAALPTLATKSYTRKQHFKRKTARATRNPNDTQFRAFADLLSLCAATEYLTQGPSSRSPGASAGSSCSFPGNWDFEYDGNKFYWRDIYHNEGSAVIWYSPTSSNVVIAVKNNASPESELQDYFFSRSSSKYIPGASIQSQILREAESLFRALEETGFLGTLRPMTKKPNKSTSKYSARNSKHGFILTGHKNGGAVACALGMILTEKGCRVNETITFGTPKFVSSRTARNWNSKLRVTRIVNELDITPVFPINGNWAHFGKEVILKENGTYAIVPSNGLMDLFSHRVLLEGPYPFLRYWWNSGRFGEIHHPAIYISPEYEENGDELADDYTDALFYCLRGIQKSKKTANSKEENQTQQNYVPNVVLLAFTIFINLMFDILGLSGSSTRFIEAEIEELTTPISPSLAKNINLKHIKIVSAYTTMYQDNIVAGNPNAPSTNVKYNESASFVSSLNSQIAKCEDGGRCADCLLFRRQHFSAPQYGAMILHPVYAKTQPKRASEIKSKAKKTERNHKKMTEESLKKSAKRKNGGKISSPMLPAQRSAIREWTRQRIIA